MAKQRARRASVPVAVRPVYEQIVRLTDPICREHLNEEYAVLARSMAEVLSRKRPSPLLSGRAATWATGILYALGRVNFLFDRTQTPHLTPAELCSLCGVSESTASAKAKNILDRLRSGPMDPQWSLPSRLIDNPLAFMVEVNGYIVDMREAPLELQEEAFRRGLIPFVPGAE